MAAAMATPLTSTTTTTTTITDSSSSSLSPQNQNNNGGNLSSPWVLVVKGGGPQPKMAEESSSEKLQVDNEGNVDKRKAWKKPNNEISSPSISALWPDLSESTRLKSSSKSNPDVSLPPLVIRDSHLQQPNSNVNTNQNSNMNSATPSRQRSMKGGGNRLFGIYRGPPPPPPLPTFPVPETRDSRGTRGFVSHSNTANEHSNHRNSNRRGNFSHHNRVNGRNNYHGTRPDHDHGNHEWSSSLSPHGRGVHGNPHRPHGRGFMSPPLQGAPPFAPPHIVVPYGNTLVYPDPALVYYIPSLPTDSFRGMPYFTGPPPPTYLVMSDPLCVSIIKQIEYYFSDANLAKDEFLKSKMDEQGWIPITLIASFPRVQNLTDNVPFILDCLRGSTIVEVKGDKVRKSEGWMNWITHQQFPSESTVHETVNFKNLTTSLQRMSLENQGNTSSALMEKELSNNLREGSAQRVC